MEGRQVVALAAEEGWSALLERPAAMLAEAEVPTPVGEGAVVAKLVQEGAEGSNSFGIVNVNPRLLGAKHNRALDTLKSQVDM